MAATARESSAPTLQIAYINGSIDASRSINVATVVRDATASTDSSTVEGHRNCRIRLVTLA